VRFPRAVAFALAVAACAVLAGGKCRAAAWIPPDPGARTASIVVAPPQLVYPLPDRFVLTGSDTARVRDRVLEPGRDYFLDAAAGEFRLNTELAPGDTVRLSYRALLLPLAGASGVLVPRVVPPRPAGADTSFARPEASAPAGSGTAAVRAGGSLPGAAPAPGASLAFTGNKTVAVDFGNTRDLALRQSLDLHATGRVAAGVDVLAVLSDRNTPVSTEGSTRELRELDKLLLEIKGPGAGATLGDLSVSEQRGTFARFNRELSGVAAQGRVGGLDGAAVLAGVKGVFVSRQFNGVDGVQGPYVLSDDDGRTGISVVAGSETVWLDGVRQARGEAADYSMDYDRGTLTFSARRLVSSASRIAIDYQVAVSAYRRNVSQVRGGWTKGPFELWAQGYREADAENRPLRTDLTDEDRLVLAAAGDDPSAALGVGVNAGPGDYVPVNDSLGVTHFTFAGTGQGSYSIQFARVDLARGDYAESTQVQGRTVYRYVGTGNGTFTPGRLLPLPTALGVVDAGISFVPRPWARLSAELAGSRYDANTFSALDDDARNGAAGQAALTLEGPLAPFGKAIGRLGVTGEVRRFDERYKSPGRLDPVFYEEEWGVNANRPLRAQDRKTGILTWRPVTTALVRAEYAELSADSGFFARRRGVIADVAGRLLTHARIERVDNRQQSVGAYANDGFRNKAEARVAWNGTPWIRPEASVDLEDRVPPSASDSAAARYRQWDAGATFPALGPVDVTVGVGQRFDAMRIAGGWDPRTRADRLKSALAWHAGGSISGALGFERRLTVPEAASAPPKATSDAGYTRFRQAFGARVGEHEIALEWTSEAQEIRERQVRFVGPGGGAYDSLGNFVGQGDYDVVLVATGTFERVARTSGTWRVDLRPGNAFADSNAWGRRLSDARLSLLLQSSLGRRGSVELADLVYGPARILERDDVASGLYVVRPELEIGSRSRWLGFLFRVERRAGADRLFEGQATTRDEWLEEGRWRSRPDPRVLGEVAVRLGQSRAEQSVSGIGGLERRLVSQGVTAEWTYLPDVVWRIGLVGSIDRADAEDDANEPSRVARLGPHVVYTRGGKFRGELLLRRAAISGGAIPALVPNGFPVLPDRWDYTLETSWRVRERANLVLSGNGHERAGSNFVHSGRVELRAYF